MMELVLTVWLWMAAFARLFNVPLNNALEATPTDAVWSRHLTSWTRYNHVRTVASTVASALYIAALLAR